MKHHVLVARTLEKRLKTMRRTGKKAELAAIQCKNLLDTMVREGFLVDEVFMKRTKNGEYRISNCVKYNLGNGYRLVTVKEGHNLFVPFVGGHDETDLWLEHHRYDSYLADDPAYRRKTISGDCQTGVDEPQDPGAYGQQVPDSYEEQLLARIDETLLKTLFQGLFHKQQA